MTIEQIKEMMNATGQALLVEGKDAEGLDYLVYENPMAGEDLVFEFDENGLFTRIFC